MTGSAYRMSQCIHNGIRPARAYVQASQLLKVTQVHRAQKRTLQISTKPSESAAPIDTLLPEPLAPTVGGSPDFRFDVLGSPYSLLSASLSASQNLYTRRGTLIGVSGKPENVTSTLSILGPVRRALLGIPFLYQKVSSTTPMTALISAKSPITSFAVVHLNGTVDWMVAQRQALLAWSGHTIAISPIINRQMSLAHWGNSQVTGRGLLALVGKGQICEVKLNAGETYVAHPSNIVAYTMTQHPPLPYRLKSTSFRLQVPKINAFGSLRDIKFFKVMLETSTWRTMRNAIFAIRTWLRRMIWGDRLFLQFHGPAIILLQTRASSLSDVLSARDVDEIADAPAGSVQRAVTLSRSSQKTAEMSDSKPDLNQPTALSFATVGMDKKVKIESTGSFEASNR